MFRLIIPFPQVIGLQPYVAWVTSAKLKLDYCTVNLPGRGSNWIKSAGFEGVAPGLCVFGVISEQTNNWFTHSKTDSCVFLNMFSDYTFLSSIRQTSLNRLHKEAWDKVDHDDIDETLDFPMYDDSINDEQNQDTDDNKMMDGDNGDVDQVTRAV